MKSRNRTNVVARTVALAVCTNLGLAQDWPQWRGSGRDGKVEDFVSPETWPATLTAGWRTSVGDGVATPALVGGKLYVFARQGEHEVVRCLDAETGREVWKQEYAVEGADGPARSFPGPRCSPTVADGKVVTLGVRGDLSVFEAATGKLLWRKTDYASWPRFYTSSSPLVVDGLCIAQLGSEGEGAVVAYDLGSGEQRWKAELGSTYASPVVMAVGDVTSVVVEGPDSAVGLDAKDGRTLWTTPFVVRGRGYNAATPVVARDGVILTGSGRGARLASIAKEGDEFSVRESWSNEEHSVQYNSPVVVGGHLYGLSDDDQLFCLDTEKGTTNWSAALKAGDDGEAARTDEGGGGRRRGGGRGGYGSIVAAGDVLLVLRPAGELVVFTPDPAAFHELARYQVAEGGAYAYPIVAGNRIFVKDQDSVALWTLGD